MLYCGVGHGLPAGMHEVEIIERARMRRAWESSLPSANDPKSIGRMRNIIDTLERDECSFREKVTYSGYVIKFYENYKFDLKISLVVLHSTY